MIIMKNNNYIIKHLEVEGFRIYSDKTHINFPTNLTVVYGRNGRGKTTLQDAISWLFNNDIIRYSDYSSEWKRSKKTHIRSLLKPQIASKVKIDFQNKVTQEIKSITRFENKIEYSNKELKNWIEDNPIKDLLWTHSLSQAKLQELAVAKGSERLEYLAPLLDLSETDKMVQDVSNTIRQLTSRKNEKKVVLENIKEVYIEDFLSKINFQIQGLMSEYRQIVDKGNETDLPYINNGSNKELEDLSKSIEHLLYYLSKIKSESNLEFRSLKEKYPELVVKENDQEFRLKSLFFDQEGKNRAKDKYNKAKYLLNTLEEKIKILKSDIKNIQELGSEGEYLSIEIQKLREEESILLEVKNNNDNIKVLLEEKNNEVNNFQKSIYEFNSRKAELDYQREIIEKNLSRYKEIKRTEKELEKKEIELRSLINKNFRSSQMSLENLNQKLTSLDKNTSNIIGQQSLVDNAIDTLINRVHDNYCPMCGLEHKSKDELISSINKKQEQWRKSFIEMTNRTRELMEEIKERQRNEFEQEVNQRRLREIENKTKNIHHELSYMKRELLTLNLEIDDDHFNASVLIDLLRFNEESIRLLLERKHQFELKLQTNIQLRDKYQNELSIWQIKVHDVTEKISDLYKKKEIIDLEINEIVKKYNYSYSTGLTLNELKKELNKSLERINQYYKEEMELRSELREYELNYAKVLYLKNESIDALISNFNVLKDQIIQLKENIYSISTKQKIELEVRELDNQITLLKKEKVHLREIQRQETNRAIGKLSKRISSIYDILSASSPWKSILPEAIVPNNREKTNLIFRPIPNLPKNKIKSYIEDTNANSTFAFSGGQLSLLGLSIFLAQVADQKNLSIQDGPELNTLILDDPIQMLDTLRDDALISLLCDIARDRQVIISTSDINFANKLILASRPLWEQEKESCGVLYYESLDENGPKIQEIQPDEWILSQRIYLPKIKNAAN